MKEKMKKTKIVCTIGPASESPKMLKKLVLAGMNVMRCNFSHGDFAEHGAKMQTMRDVNAELGTNCAILLDTKGPEIRTGDFEGGAANFKKGHWRPAYPGCVGLGAPERADGADLTAPGRCGEERL